MQSAVAERERFPVHQGLAEHRGQTLDPRAAQRTHLQRVEGVPARFLHRARRDPGGADALWTI
jgi:hypothetical protein